MSVSDRFETKLQVELEKRIQPDTANDIDVKSSFIAIILPILINLLSQWMEGCNDTPERAAKRVKRMGVWTRNNLLNGVKREPELNDVRTECCESVKAVVANASIEELTEINKEHSEESINWTPFGGVQ